MDLIIAIIFFLIVSIFRSRRQVKRVKTRRVKEYTPEIERFETEQTQLQEELTTEEPKNYESEPITFSQEKITDVVQEKESSSKKITFNKSDFVNGIIMSEILQPPRAKRPYRIRR